MESNKNKAMNEYLHSNLSMKEIAKKYNMQSYSFYLYMMKISFYEGFSIIRLN